MGPKAVARGVAKALSGSDNVQSCSMAGRAWGDRNDRPAPPNTVSRGRAPCSSAGVWRRFLLLQAVASLRLEVTKCRK